jgi:hypothetical protein
MTPQEKSREIVIRMQFQQPPLMFEQAKHCALIAIDEIYEECVLERDWYWEKVKQEIEKL